MLTGSALTPLHHAALRQVSKKLERFIGRWHGETEKESEIDG